MGPDDGPGGGPGGDHEGHDHGEGDHPPPEGLTPEMMEAFDNSDHDGQCNMAASTAQDTADNEELMELHMMAATFVCGDCQDRWADITAEHQLDFDLGERCGELEAHLAEGGDGGEGHDGGEEGHDGPELPEGWDEMSLDDQCWMAGNHVNDGAQ